MQRYKTKRRRVIRRNRVVGSCWCGGNLRREGVAIRCDKCDRISYPSVLKEIDIK